MKTLLTSTLAAALLLTAPCTILANDTAHKDHPRKTTSESEQPVTDSWITTKVKTELLAAKDVKGSDINVSTKNGVVTLAGVLDSQAEVDKAVSIAHGVKGVKQCDTRALKVR